VKTALKSHRIYAESGPVDGAILIENGKIAAVIPNGAPLPPDAQVVDYANHRIIPGIIDLHVHGFKGWGAKTLDRQEVKNMAKALASVGVTAFQPTNTAWDYQVENTAVIADAIEEGYEGARILGIHLEGPFYNVIRHGGTAAEDVKPPSLDLMKRLWEAGRGHVTYMTIAAEVPGAGEVIDFCLQKGMILGIGHSDATYAQAIAAIDRGVRVAIHSFNAMRPIHQREVSLFGAVLLDKRIYNELIPDFYHVCPEMIRILLEMKPLDKILLMSDSDAMSAMKPGRYNIKGVINISEKSGLMHLEDGTINSSSKYVLYGIGNLVEKLGLPLQDVLRMSAKTPAEVMGIANRKGSVAIGKDADLAVIDDDYEAVATYVEGVLAFNRSTSPDLCNPKMDELLVEAFE
jgi:N-acetylglucosamine-6-phosphate deacetylase